MGKGSGVQAINVIALNEVIAKCIEPFGNSTKHFDYKTQTETYRQSRELVCNYALKL